MLSCSSLKSHVCSHDKA